MGPGHAGTSRRHSNIAPATQKERKTTKNFSGDTKILHLPHKEVGSQRTSRRHRKYCTCHTKSVSVTCDSSQQASIRSGDNISEASKLLHLPRKTHGKGHKLSIVYRVTSDPNVGRVTRLVDVWAGPGSSHLRPYPKGR